MAKPKCPKCGGELFPGIGHNCVIYQPSPVSVVSVKSFDWRWAAGIIFTLILATVSWIWEASAAKQQFLDLKDAQMKENDKVEQRLDRIEGYFLKPPSR